MGNACNTLTRNLLSQVDQGFRSVPRELGCRENTSRSTTSVHWRGRIDGPGDRYQILLRGPKQDNAYTAVTTWSGYPPRCKLPELMAVIEAGTVAARRDRCDNCCRAGPEASVKYLSRVRLSLGISTSLMYLGVLWNALPCNASNHTACLAAAQIHTGKEVSQ
jgi:hypothetical protein